MIKTHWWHSLNQNCFCEMNAYHLPYLSLLNGETNGVVFILANERRLQNQVYRQIKSKHMDTFGFGKSSLFERVDFSLYCFLSSLSKFK